MQTAKKHPVAVCKLKTLNYQGKRCFWRSNIEKIPASQTAFDLLKARVITEETRSKTPNRLAVLVHLTRSSMSERQIKKNNIGFFKIGRQSCYPAVQDIPIQFTSASPLSFQIKVQPHKSVSHPVRYAVGKPLIPALFQIAACADDVKSLSDLQGALATVSASFKETLLDPQKLKGVLKAIARKKKPAHRRMPASRIC